MRILEFLLLFVGAMALIARPCRCEDEVIALVNGTEISRPELEFEAARLMTKTYFHRQASQEDAKTVRKQALENLLTREMIYAEALSRGYLINEEQLEGSLKSIKKNFLSEREFEKSLEKRGLTPEGLRRLLVRENMEALFLRAEVDDKALPAEGELEGFFEGHREKFRAPEEVRVFHITIGVPPSSAGPEWESARIRAEDLVKRIRGGEDIAVLARLHSTDAYRDKGGDLGQVHRGRLEPELEQVAFSQGPGEVSNPVKTMQGYSIIRTGEKSPARPLDFSEAGEKVRKQFVELRKKELREKLMTFLKKKYSIEIRDADLK